MRIVFSSLPGYGHVYPLLALAIASRDAGHDVVFATDGAYLASLRACGLSAARAGMSFDEAFAASLQQEPQLLGRTPGTDLTRRQFCALKARMFGHVFPCAFVEDLYALLTRFGADLVVYETANPGAFLAARLSGVPSVCHGFGRGRFGPGVEELFPTRLRECAREFDVELPASLGLAYGDPYLDICPPSLRNPVFAETVERFPLRTVAMCEPADLPGWITERRRSRPLIYLTLGTAYSDRGVLQTALQGLADLDADVLAVTGPRLSPEALGSVPSNANVERWVPQADLLAHVDLVIHHGGSGTMLCALSFGLPQLLLPRGADHFGNADAVLVNGLGDRILERELSPDEVAVKTHALLSDARYRKAARRTAAEIAEMPTPAELQPLLGELAAEAATPAA